MRRRWRIQFTNLRFGLDQLFHSHCQLSDFTNRRRENRMWSQLPVNDLERVAETVRHLYDPSTSGNPSLTKHWQHELQQIQTSPEAWGLINGLATHDDPNVRFFSAHTAQVKISRDWESLPSDRHSTLLQLLLETLGNALSPVNPQSYQPANGVVVRKLFGSVRLPLLRRHISKAYLSFRW